MESFQNDFAGTHLFNDQDPQQQQQVGDHHRGGVAAQDDIVATMPNSDLRRKNSSSGMPHDRMPDILRLEMMSLLHTKPLTGYELRKSIKASFNHEISFGTLYPNLASLERAGLIQGQWVSLGESQLRRKRIFTLTDAGKNFLAENLAKLNKITGVMQKMSLDPIKAV